jgi:hypothetical protein
VKAMEKMLIIALFGVLCFLPFGDLQSKVLDLHSLEYNMQK